MAGAVEGEQGRAAMLKDAVKGGADIRQMDKVARMGRRGGSYIPPFKLAQMLREANDAAAGGGASAEYQRLAWDALRKTLNGLVNKVNTGNIKEILPEVFSENLIRGRGLLARSLMKSQMASPAFTPVYAALVAIVNTKFPEMGLLLLRRVLLQFRRSFRRNDKHVCLAATRFIAHLVNQQVAHEVVALELITLLLETPTTDSVEVAVSFIKDVGATLSELTPQGMHMIFDRFRGILHEGEIDKRVQYMIEGLFALRKANFEGFPALTPELDLVESEDQITHEVSLDEDIQPESKLDVFSFDPNYEENEAAYAKLRKEILGEDDEDEDDGDDSEDEEGEEGGEEQGEPNGAVETGASGGGAAKQTILDMTETDLVNLRRTIYLTIMSSIDFEEAGHKLLKLRLQRGLEPEVATMLLECCTQERTYIKYYGLLAQRFCHVDRLYQTAFEDIFFQQYQLIHRLETNKLRNCARLFGHLMASDAISWEVLGPIRITEADTTSSSRNFLKILFQDLAETLGLRKLNERLQDPELLHAYEGIFPRDSAKNTRFGINFFTSIGLGGVTDELREYLKNPRYRCSRGRRRQGVTRPTPTLTARRRAAAAATRPIAVIAATRPIVATAATHPTAIHPTAMLAIVQVVAEENRRGAGGRHGARAAGARAAGVHHRLGDRPGGWSRFEGGPVVHVSEGIDYFHHCILFSQYPIHKSF